jgi:hypothetical protein
MACGAGQSGSRGGCDQVVLQLSRVRGRSALQGDEVFIYRCVLTGSS